MYIHYLLLVGVLLLALHGEGLSGKTSRQTLTTEQLLARVPNGTSWQDLTPDLRADFEKRALSFLAKDRRSWGLLVTCSP